MSTPRKISYRWREQVEEVAALLRDPGFLKSRCEAAGETNVEVQIDPVPDGLRVVVARDKEMELPAFAKRMFNPHSRIVDATLWRRVGAGWEAEYDVEVVGMPRVGTVRGTLKLLPVDGGCEFVSEFEVDVRIPLVGGKLETFVADGMEDSWRSRCAPAQELREANAL